MAFDRRMIEIHSPKLAIGFNGNLLLDTVGQEAGQVQLGNIPYLGGKGIPTEIAISAAAGASNICNVLFQLQDMGKVNVAHPMIFDVWLSDAATGAALTSASFSTGIAAISSDGIVWLVQTAGKAVRVQANASGLFGLAITDTGKNLVYPCAQNAMTGLVTVGAKLVTANYG